MNSIARPTPPVSSLVSHNQVNHNEHRLLSIRWRKQLKLNSRLPLPPVLRLNNRRRRHSLRGRSQKETPR